jgi:hypothetical protein
MDVELSDGTRGAVKGYADAMDLPLTTAYEELLHRGITHAAHRSSRHSPDEIKGGSLDEVYYSPIADDRGLTAYTFQRSFPKQEYLTFGGWPTSSVNTDFVTLLSRLRPYLSRPERAWFSISNYAGHWYGKGLRNFYTAVMEHESRYEADYAGKRHTNETAFFVASLGNYGYVAINTQPRHPSETTSNAAFNPLEKVELRFLVEGYPLDTSVHEAIARQFNVDFIAASRLPVQRATVTVEPHKTVEPVTLMLEDDDPPDDEPFVRGAIIPNPLRESAQLRSELEFTEPDGTVLADRHQQSWREHASRVEYVPLQFHGPDPTERMFSEIVLNSITVTDSTGLAGIGHTNIEVVGSDIE